MTLALIVRHAADIWVLRFLVFSELVGGRGIGELGLLGRTGIVNLSISNVDVEVNTFCFGPRLLDFRPWTITQVRLLHFLVVNLPVRVAALATVWIEAGESL